MFYFFVHAQNGPIIVVTDRLWILTSLIVQVYPGAWTAILISLDNVGVWNIRTENLDSWYLGQETYIRVVNPEATNKTELPLPDNALYCGALSKLQKYACWTHVVQILHFHLRKKKLTISCFSFAGQKISPPQQFQSW